MKNNIDCLNNYRSCLPKWNKFASIRSRPHRILSVSEGETGYYYPLERQAIAIHPLVRAKGEGVVGEILLQTAYKFMLDIAHVEVELINNTALKIYNGTLDYGYPQDVKKDMLTIIIDEAYHAYIALDYVEQLKSETNISPIYVSNDVELGYYMQKHMAGLSTEDAAVFEIMAICIGENTLTKELFSMTKQESLNPFFHQVMADHMIDEGRHSSLFRLILRKTWATISEEQKISMGEVLSKFVIDYTSDELHNEFNELLLRHIGFNENDIKKITSDTKGMYEGARCKSSNPVSRNIMDMLKHLGVLDHEHTLKCFYDCGLVEEVVC